MPMTLDHISTAISICEQCGLHRGRKNTVPGVGPDNARIMFVGEGPGAEEDEAGEPFVGASGNLLTRLLNDSGIKREKVFITNVVKCRPPGNRDPSPEETVTCKRHLADQIRAVQPKVIITLGKHAAWHVTMHYGPMGGLMALTNLKCHLGNVSVPVVACYHPAYLLRLLQTDKVRAKDVYGDYINRLMEAAEKAK